MTPPILEVQAYHEMMLARPFVRAMTEEAARLRAEADRLARAWRLHGADE